MRGFVRAQPQWLVDAGTRWMVLHRPPTVNDAAPELNIDGCYEFMGCEDRQATEHLPYGDAAWRNCGVGIP